ncbi:T-lymphoma invasion and metastasis-inducing protein 1-like isoform X1 [Xiphophorus couchianus]|uniref:T-lymphoma invasion and metastasis-inducing protein 1-like isoform X1 n=1 Tax=Xiphophorus couchianus TaxID=32473 RepID=UPI001016ED9B|nr:T-lymphoma invasion and metastasis-inducing protein 1-like isoform X1 [Xiphophorus couchianus]
MGNVESQNGDSSVYGNETVHLSRKQTSRSLRLTNKKSVTRRQKLSSTVKQEYRNSETSTRSSSTPSIPQSLAESGLELFNGTDELGEFGINPHWTQRISMTMRPDSYQHEDEPLATPTPETSEADTIAQDGAEDSLGEGDVPGEERYLQRMTEGTRDGGTFKKKRSKSADMWREDSLEFSMSDLSQENLTSTEDIIDGGEEEEEEQFTRLRGSSGSTERASSLDHLCSQQSPGLRGQRNRYIKNHREAKCNGDTEAEDGLMSPMEEDGSGYGAFTLPCRRSHCLSEGLSGLGIPSAPCPAFQGRRAHTTQDISGTMGDGSEYGDSGIDGVATETDADGELISRRCKAMSASFSLYSATESSVFNGSDSGSSSAGGGDGRVAEGCRGGVYENFRKELESQTNQGRDFPEEASSAVSDEQSSGTLSSAYPSDMLTGCAQGTVRKAGALAVKNFLVHKKNMKVELATKRKWKQYWVSLKGCSLFLYESDGRSVIDHNNVAKHALWVENSIVQAVPEHPKKDYVFCLSNSMGDAFLFQTSGQTELENWITAIHSACATALARQHHREDTVRLLRTEIRKLEQKIDMDEKMKKMGDMQLSAVTDAKKRKTILEQIFLWEQNLERFHIDLFRCRCYLASLQGGEPPNPKRLLGFASRPTKMAMGRLGIFSVSSFHALVSARTEGSIRKRNQAVQRTFSKRRSRFSSLWGLDTASRRKTKGHPSAQQVFENGTDPVRKPLELMFEDSASEISKKTEDSMKTVPQQSVDSDIWVPDYLKPSWVCLPNNQPVLAIVQPGETTVDVLSSVCKSHQLEPSGHYLRVKVWVDNQLLYYVPKSEEEISDLIYKEIEICPRATKVICFDKAESSTIGYGFTVAVTEEDDIQRLHVIEVKPGGLASAKGLKAGDEIQFLNGKPASALQLDDLRAAFGNHMLTLIVSTLPQLDSKVLCFCPPHRTDGEQDSTTDIFSQSQENILDEVSGLTVESPDESMEEGPLLTLQSPRDHHNDRTLMAAGQKSTEQVTAFCRSLHDMNPLECPMSSSSSSSSSSLSPSPVSALAPAAGTAAQRQLSHADKLRKVISELVETEKTYVKDLRCLIECYLKPLQKESFLTQDELDVLFGNLEEMVEFQLEFLRTLEDGIRLVPDLERLERVDQFKKVLFSLGGSFLYYADRFKIYSAFCASHTKVPKVLAKAKTDPEFKAFLAERNPRQQHSSTLESYLIKPIQRVLKYPLLLRELYSLTDPDSEEHYHLDVAMKAMNKVASHINEMQKLHEEYGAVFDQLINEQTADNKQVLDLSMGDLLLHSTVAWMNAPATFGKSKKDPELSAFVFKTAVVFVYKNSSKHRKKIGGSHRATVSEDRDHFRFRYMIATDSLQVRAAASSDATAVCELVHTRSESEGRPERIFQLCCSSPESKKDFLKAVQSILREKQRRHILKTKSMPLNQKYVPFGGKRLTALKGARPAMNRAASAPSRTLSRRSLLKNHITIDADQVFHGTNNNSTDVTSISHRPTCSPSSSSPSKHEPHLSHKHQAEDTDRWVEEQFNLRRYEDQCEDIDDRQVKETDILSDDDEYCKSLRGPSAEPDSLEAGVGELRLHSKEVNLNRKMESRSEMEQGVKVDRTKQRDDSDSFTSCSLSVSSSSKLTPLKQQCSVEGATSKNHDMIWVRRDDFNKGCNSDVF